MNTSEDVEVDRASEEAADVMLEAEVILSGLFA